MDSELVLLYSVELNDWLQKQDDIYILVEAAINPFVRELALSQYLSEETSLYWRRLGEEHASISPYLLKLNDWQEFATRIAKQANWGIFIRVQPDTNLLINVQKKLLRHLEEWAFIETPNEESMLLRISDFQVLKTLCMASNADELNGIFESIWEFAYWQQGQRKVDVLALGEIEAEEWEPHSPQQLSERQYAALQAFAALNQNKQYAEHLKAHHPEVNDWQDSKLADFLTKNSQKAHSYFFENKRDTVRYLSLAVVFGEDFDSQAWAKEILTIQSVEGVELRMDKLYQAAFEQIENKI